MIVNKQSIQAIFSNIKTTFHKAFEAAPSTWDKIAMLVPSNSSQNDYTWLENFPKMRRWIGSKHIKSLKARNYVIVNDDFEATIAVKRNDIEDDNTGMLKPQAEGAGHSAKQWPDELVYEAVNKGTTETCFDGQYFFDTDHEVGTQSVSNKFSKPLDVSTQAAAIASFGFVRTAMKNIKDEEGRPLNITPNVLLVPPALEDKANVLMNNDKFDDGKPNPYKGTAEVVVDARIASDTAWYLLDTTKPVKPFVFQQRKKPVFISKTDITSDHVFMTGEYIFGVEARGEAGFGFWQLAAKGN